MKVIYLGFQAFDLALGRFSLGIYLVFGIVSRFFEYLGSLALGIFAPGIRIGFGILLCLLGR